MNDKEYKCSVIEECVGGNSNTSSLIENSNKL